MSLSKFCLGMAALCALGGMSLGIHMGTAGDFTLAPAHAHLNLLGWVTMALYGLWHRTGRRASGALAWTQASCGALGAALMSSGLGLMLANGHDPVFAPLIIAGALFAFTGMALFLLLVLAERPGEAETSDRPAPGYGWPA